MRSGEVSTMRKFIVCTVMINLEDKMGMEYIKKVGVLYCGGETTGKEPLERPIHTRRTKLEWTLKK